MVHIPLSLSVGKKAYFSFNISVLDVVNIPYLNGEYDLKYNFKGSILNPLELQHLHDPDMDKPSNSPTADVSHSKTGTSQPTNGEAASLRDSQSTYRRSAASQHDIKSMKSGTMYSSSLRMSHMSQDPEAEDRPSDEDGQHRDQWQNHQQARQQQQEREQSRTMSRHDKSGHFRINSLDKNSAANFNSVLQGVVAIPIRRNALTSCRLKFSIRRLSKKGSGQEWVKFGGVSIDLSKQATKVWNPHIAQAACRKRRRRFAASPSHAHLNQEEEDSGPKTRRYLFTEDGRTNALLRIRMSFAFLGGDPYQDMPAEPQKQEKAGSSASTHSSEIVSPVGPQESYEPENGREASAIIDDLWNMVRAEQSRSSFGPTNSSQLSLSSDAEDPANSAASDTSSPVHPEEQNGSRQHGDFLYPPSNDASGSRSSWKLNLPFGLRSLSALSASSQSSSKVEEGG